MSFGSTYGLKVAVWLLRKEAGTDAGSMQRLRLMLLRLHAEQQCLREIYLQVAKNTHALSHLTLSLLHLSFPFLHLRSPSLHRRFGRVHPFAGGIHLRFRVG